MKPLCCLIAMTLLTLPGIAGERAFWDFESVETRPFQGIIWRNELHDSSEQTL